MSKEFKVELFPCKDVPSLAVANAEFAVKTQAVLRGRLSVMGVDVDGQPGYIFDSPDRIVETVMRTIDSIEQDENRASTRRPTIVVTHPTDIDLQQIHKTAIKAIRF